MTSVRAATIRRDNTTLHLKAFGEDGMSPQALANLRLILTVGLSPERLSYLLFRMKPLDKLCVSIATLNEFLCFNPLRDLAVVLLDLCNHECDTLMNDIFVRLTKHMSFADRRLLWENYIELPCHNALCETHLLTPETYGFRLSLLIPSTKCSKSANRFFIGFFESLPGSEDSIDKLRFATKWYLEHAMDSYDAYLDDGELPTNVGRYSENVDYHHLKTRLAAIAQTPAVAPVENSSAAKPAAERDHSPVRRHVTQ